MRKFLWWIFMFVAWVPTLQAQVTANAGIYDDRDPRIAYSGSGWANNNDPNRYQGTQSFSNHAGDTASFTFTGAQVSYVYSRQSNLGNLQITIDGVVKAEPSNLYVPPPNEIGEQVVTYSGLSNATHTIVVQVVGTPVTGSNGANVVIDAFIVGPVGALDGIYDDRDSQIAYSGSGWGNNNDPNRYQGTQSFSNHAGDTASFTFTGAQVSYVYSRQFNLGNLQITIDGVVKAAPSNLYAPPPNEIGEQVVTYSGLSNATHTITVQVVGTPVTGSNGANVVIDAFIVGPVGAFDGIYDDRDPRIAYTGSAWGHNNDPLRYQTTQSFSSQAGDAASFTFTGTQVSYIYAKQANLGYVQVSIDGLLMPQVDAYSLSEIGEQVLTYSGLANRTHTITVQAAGVADPQSGGAYIVVDAFLVGSVGSFDGIYDDRDPKVIYVGSGWAQNSLAGRYNNTQSFSNQAGNTASFTFTGTQIGYMYESQSNLGKAQIALDGYVITPQLDEYSSTPSGQTVASYSGLTNRTHTMTITALGAANTQSSNSYVIVDAFTLSNPPLPPDAVTIVGQVLAGGMGISGVSVLLTGSESLSTTTDLNGNYSFAAPAGGNYTVVPSLSGQAFSPSSFGFSNIGTNQLNANFTELAGSTVTIGGNISEGGSAASGVTVLLNGGVSGSAITDVDGNYSFTVGSGLSYVVAPSQNNVSFIPASQSFSNIGAAQTGNFTADPAIFTIEPQFGSVNSTVAIAGAHFGAAQNTSAVTFNGITALPTSWSSTRIVVTVPSGATTGTVLVRVGGVASNGIPYTVMPSILNLSLPSGPVQMGFVITGTSFGSSQGDSTASLSGVPLTVISWSDTSITVQLPTGATSGNVAVTAVGHTSNGLPFTVTPSFGCSN